MNDLLRELAPQVLGALVRHHGGFDACEDAVQEALLAASQQWPRDGIPDNPRGWLITVASDWPQILALYDLLAAVAPGPMVTLNRVVAVAMVRGPEAGLRALADPGLVTHHRVDAVRAHLLEETGDLAAAAAAYRRAARATLSVPEQRYLTDRAERVGGS